MVGYGLSALIVGLHPDRVLFWLLYNETSLAGLFKLVLLTHSKRISCSFLINKYVVWT